MDLEHRLTLEVGKAHSYVFRGNKKFDQRVSFRLEAKQVASKMIKKVRAK